MSLTRYRQTVAVTIALLALIVLTGAAVRLTQAGLGCSDWPNCHEGELLPEQEDLLGLIEYGNRMLSGIVGLATLAVAALTHRVRPRRHDLIPWAWGLVAGSAAQVLLGAAVVRLELNPIAVAGHFLLTMVMIWNALVLWIKSGTKPERAKARFDGAFASHGRIVVGMITLVLVVGTLVTGTGPNSGDSRAVRLGFDFTTIARTHSVLAWLFVLASLTLALRLRKIGPTPDALLADPIRLSRLLLYVGAAQGAVGYWQYLTGVPPLLVELHVLGSVTLWIVALLTHFSLSDREWFDRTRSERQHTTADRNGDSSKDLLAPSSTPG